MQPFLMNVSVTPTERFWFDISSWRSADCYRAGRQHCGFTRLDGMPNLNSVPKVAMSRLSFMRNSGNVGGAAGLLLLLVVTLYQATISLWSWLTGSTTDVNGGGLELGEHPLLLAASAGTALLAFACQRLGKRAREFRWRACLISTEESANYATYLTLGAWYFSLHQEGNASWGTVVGAGLAMFISRWRQAAHELAPKEV